jgi:hypothetical protein
MVVTERSILVPGRATCLDPDSGFVGHGVAGPWATGDRQTATSRTDFRGPGQRSEAFTPAACGNTRLPDAPPLTCSGHAPACEDRLPTGHPSRAHGPTAWLPPYPPAHARPSSGERTRVRTPTPQPAAGALLCRTPTGGWVGGGAGFPRALPWAGMYRPFRAPDGGPGRSGG